MAWLFGTPLNQSQRQVKEAASGFAGLQEHQLNINRSGKQSGGGGVLGLQISALSPPETQWVNQLNIKYGGHPLESPHLSTIYHSQEQVFNTCLHKGSLGHQVLCF